METRAIGKMHTWNAKRHKPNLTKQMTVIQVPPEFIFKNEGKINTYTEKDWENVLLVELLYKKY
jgi:hypothetical protein